jgi:glyoxylase-like metal-dependent hydrolase (beta-lactamase superfamily II)
MIIKLSERIYYMPHNGDTDRPILGYIKGDKYSLMIDAGNSKEHVNLFLGELSKLGLTYPNFVVLTHSHWDHTYGLCGLNSISIACNKTNEHLKIMKEWEWTDSAMQKRIENKEDIEFCDTMIKKEYADRSQICIKTVDVVFEDKLSINLGNVQCEFMRLESSHADDCVVINVPDEKKIFIGDIICEDLHYKEPVYYKDKLNSLINDFISIDFETALFGHLEPLTKKEVLDILNNENAIVI